MTDCWAKRRIKVRFSAVLLIYTAALLSGGLVRAEQDLLPSITVSPGNITVTLTKTATLEVPTDIAVFPDGSGRMLVTEGYNSNIQILDSAGHVLGVYHNSDSNDTYPFSFNDIANTSVAFHPGFADPGSPGYKKFYNLESEKADTATPDFEPKFSSGNSHQQVLYEYTVDDPSANVIDTGGGFTKREVMRLRQPVRSHNANDLLFDDAGMLYFSIGDGANTSVERQNSQPLDTVFGKSLRIDPLGIEGVSSANGAYSIPTSNPFFNTVGADKEILVNGVRNAYRISIDPETGYMYVGDVGQNNVEEIDVIPNLGDVTPAGQNFGWVDKEGSYLFISDNDLDPDPDNDENGNGDYADTNGMTDPILEYDHQDGATVLGGFVYRGSSMPWLVGKYVFADQQGCRDANEPIPNVARFFYGDLETGEIFEFNIDESNDTLPDRLVGINEDADGEIYLLGLDGVYKVGALSGPAWNGIDGDVNQNGVFFGDGTGPAETDDISAFISGWLSTGLPGLQGTYESYTHGDINFDGTTDLDDAFELRLFLAQQGVSSPALVALINGEIPEPTTFVLVMSLITALTAARCRLSGADQGCVEE